MAVAAIELINLCHWYGTGSMRRQVLQGVNLGVEPGEVVLLTGPSGCGKTTLLTLVGALRQVLRPTGAHTTHIHARARAS